MSSLLHIILNFRLHQINCVGAMMSIVIIIIIKKMRPQIWMFNFELLIDCQFEILCGRR